MMRFSYLLLLVLCFYPALSVEAWSWRPTAKPPTPPSGTSIDCSTSPDLSGFRIVNGDLNILAGDNRSGDVYVLGKVNINKADANANTTYTGSIYATGDVYVGKKVTVKGFVYSEGIISQHNQGNIQIEKGSCSGGTPIPPIELPVDELRKQCNSIFKDAAQSHNGGKLTVYSNGTIDDATTAFDFKSVEQWGNPNGCGVGTPCTITGKQSTALSDFTIPTISGNNIFVENQNITLGNTGTVFGRLEVKYGTLTLAERADQIYLIDRLNLYEAGKVELYAGIYALGGLQIAQPDSQIKVLGEGTVYLFVNKIDSIQGNIIKQSASSRVVIVTNDTLSINNNAQIHADIYSKFNVILNTSADVYGRIAASNLTMNATNPKIKNTLNCSAPPADIYTFAFTGTSSNGITCEPHSVQIQVLLGANVDINYTQTITLTTSTGLGDWSIGNAQGTLENGIAGDGQATYTFVAPDNGEIVLLLEHRQRGGVTITVANSDATATFDVNFGGAIIKSAFSCSTQIAANCINIANHPFDLTLTALKENTADSKCINYNPSAISFWSKYSNPTTPEGLPVAIAGQDISNDPLMPTAIPLPFSGGVATVSANYPDAGKIAVHVSDVDDATIQSGVITIVKPYQLIIDNVTKQQRNVDSTRVVSAAGFIRASVPDYANLTVDTFDVTVNALKYCDDSTTSVHCTDTIYGNKTPSFANDITLDPSLIFPTSASASKGTLYSENGLTKAMQLSDKGKVTYHDLAFDEVGILGLTTISDNYIAAGNAISAADVKAIGRFYPDYLAFTEGSYRSEPVCSANDFAYMGQPDAITVSYQLAAFAQTHIGNVAKITRNYDADFTYPVAESFQHFAYDASGGELIGFKDNPYFNRIFSNNDYNQSLWKQGEYNALPSSMQNFTLGLKRAVDATNKVAPDGPFSNGNEVRYRIQLTGIDGEKLQTGLSQFCADDKCEIGELNDLMYGRLQAENGHGSEFQAIRTNVQSTYFNGTAFIPMRRDQCTSITMQQISSDPIKNSNDEIVVGSGVTKLTLTNEILINGLSYFDFAAPSSPGELDYYIDLHSNAPWLLDSGNEVLCAGEFNCISGHVQFGLYRGNERIIYRLQTFNEH